MDAVGLIGVGLVEASMVRDLMKAGFGGLGTHALIKHDEQYHNE